MLRLTLAAVFAILLGASAAPAVERIDRVRVEKGERRMDLIADGRVVRGYAIALGGDPVGHKQREGDGRTPEGLYVLDWRNAQSSFYKSIHVSYPDAADKASARRRGVDPGGMIMIHGQPNGYGWAAWAFQWFDWTDGCIAVTNSEMDEIWNLVRNGTPIEIAP